MHRQSPRRYPRDKGGCFVSESKILRRALLCVAGGKHERIRRHDIVRAHSCNASVRAWSASMANWLIACGSYSNSTCSSAAAVLRPGSANQFLDFRSGFRALLGVGKHRHLIGQCSVTRVPPLGLLVAPPGNLLQCVPQSIHPYRFNLDPTTVISSWSVSEIEEIKRPRSYPPMLSCKLGKSAGAVRNIAAAIITPRSRSA